MIHHNSNLNVNIYIKFTASATCLCLDLFPHEQKITNSETPVRISGLYCCTHCTMRTLFWREFSFIHSKICLEWSLSFRKKNWLQVTSHDTVPKPSTLNEHVTIHSNWCGLSQNAERQIKELCQCFLDTYIRNKSISKIWWVTPLHPVWVRVDLDATLTF